VACLEANCNCGWTGFGNDSLKLAECPKCGQLTEIQHDEFGSCVNPKELNRSTK